MIRIAEAILVEGRYDKNVLSQVVEAAIFETCGFGIFRDKEKIAFLRQVAEKKGLIIFTDSDGAGFVIRNKLKGLLPQEKVLHAYIPDIQGKEKRKKRGSKEGLLGVEGMSPEIIINALKRCGAHILDEYQTAIKPDLITRQDLYELGLMGGAHSAEMRNYVKQKLMLPSHLGTSAFLDALNLVTNCQELKRIMAEKPIIDYTM